MDTSRFSFRTSCPARFAGRLALAAAHILAGLAAAWLILRHYPGDRWLPVRLGSYFAPWLFLALLPVAGAAVVARRRRLATAVFLLLVVFGGRFGPFIIPHPAPASAGAAGHTLRVMTFNVHFDNRNAAGIIRLVQAEKPDIIAMQEVVGGLVEPLFTGLKPDYPYQVVYGSGLAAASRYPLAAQPAPAGLWRVQQLTAATPQGDVKIWNIHPPVAVSQKGWEAQRQIFSGLAGQVKAEKLPVIVLGDFNTTTQAENYALLAAHLADVQQATGLGLDFTFPQLASFAGRLPWYLRPLSRIKPVVHIDHILASAHFAPVESHIVAEELNSDHRPVVATLRWTGQ